MAHIQDRKPHSRKMEDARDLQSKLYREIGITAVAAALRFTSQSASAEAPAVSHPLPAILRGDDLAA